MFVGHVLHFCTGSFSASKLFSLFPTTFVQE